MNERNENEKELNQTAKAAQADGPPAEQPADARAEKPTEAPRKKSVPRRVLGILGNVLLYSFLALCIFMVVITLMSKKDSDGAATIFGFQMRTVLSASMDEHPDTDVSEYDIKSFPVKTLLFIRTVPEDPAKAQEFYDSLEVGDVLTIRFTYTNQVTITHRITSITPKETGGYIIELQGDNKGDPEFGATSNVMTQTVDTSLAGVSNNYIIGKVVAKSLPLGYLLTLLKQPIGIVLVVIVPCFIVILLEVLKIVGVLSAEKKKREQEKQEQQTDEIEELRRKLAALERNQMAASQAPPAPTAVTAGSTQGAEGNAPTEAINADAGVGTADRTQTSEATEATGPASEVASEVAAEETAEETAKEE